MPEGYCPDSKDDQLDELMCEYVDGTMDPTVRAAFEEFLDANPEMLEEVRCLCQTRDMLCSYGFRHTPRSVECHMRQRVVSELGRQDRTEKLLTDRLASIALVTSAVGLMLIVGMVVGLSNVDRPQVVGEQVAVNEPESAADSMVLPTDAHTGLTKSVPMEWVGEDRGAGLMARVYALPVISASSHMTPRDWPAWLPSTASQQSSLIRTSAVAP